MIGVFIFPLFSVYHGDCIRAVFHLLLGFLLCLSVYHGDCIATGSPPCLPEMSFASACTTGIASTGSIETFNSKLLCLSVYHGDCIGKNAQNGMQ